MLPINTFHLAMNATAFFISITLLAYSFLQRRIDKYQQVAFVMMVVVVIMNSMTETFVEIIAPYKNISSDAFFFCEVLQTAYFVFHVLLAPFFYFYETCVTGIIKKSKDIENILLYAPMFFLEILVLTNPVTHFVFYYDADRVFNRNWGEAFVYLIGIFYFVTSFINLLYLWKALDTRQRWSILYFFIVVVLGIGIQLLFPEVKCELFAEAIALLGVMITVESEYNRLEPDTGIYNRIALHTDIENFAGVKAKFDIVIVKLDGLDEIYSSVGVTNINRLTNAVSRFLTTIIQRYYIYNVDPGQFVIMVSKGIEDPARAVSQRLFARFESKYTTDEVIEKILERFERDWIVDRYTLKLRAGIVKVNFPKDIDNEDDLFNIINSPLPKNAKKQVYEGEDLSYILRRTVVEQAITRGLRDGNFEVYYQPTYHTDSLAIHGAEALLRLHDPELGDIKPAEFIPVAENMDLVDDLDEFVLHEVCKFVKTGIPKKAGMDCINLNLSVIQCMKSTFSQHINSIVESYGIDKSFINFEITESVAADDYNILRDVITELKAEGFSFSMDDYGTGYSNITSSFSLDFDEIKIDKSILWGAEKSELGMSIFTNVINMIKDMKREIVVEGVETINQVQLLKRLKVDYLQGFYFSQPISKSQLIMKLGLSEDRETGEPN